MNFDKLQADIVRVAAARKRCAEAAAAVKAASQELELARAAVADAEHNMSESLMDLVDGAK